MAILEQRPQTVTEVANTTEKHFNVAAYYMQGTRTDGPGHRALMGLAAAVQSFRQAEQLVQIAGEQGI